MHSSEHIRGSEKLIAVFGEWPTFHDAEVVLFSAERAIPVKVGDNIARLVIHLRSYASKGEGTANYQMVLTKRVLAKFVFALACDLELFHFNHQNVINSFTVSPFQTTELCIPFILSSHSSVLSGRSSPNEQLISLREA